MTSLRFAQRCLCTVASFAACAAPVHSAAAQWIPEIAGGWNYRQSAPQQEYYTLGSGARLSLGRRLTDNFILRLDAIVSQYGKSDSVGGGGIYSCFASCQPPPPQWSIDRVSYHVAGLTMNGIVELDPRGIFYMIAGAGRFESNSHTPASYDETHLGGSFGTGIAIPIGARLRATLEARFQGMFGATAGTPWVVPVTVGLRY